MLNKTLPVPLFYLGMVLLLVCGLVGIWLLNQIVNPSPNNKFAGLNSPVTTRPVSLTLNLSGPEDNLLVTSPDLLVTGKTAPNTTLILSTKDKDQALQASGGGEFSTTLTLQEGENELTLTAFDDNGNSKQEIRTVYYSKEKI